MKTRIITLLIALTASVAAWAANAGIEFAQKEYDFGTIAEKKGKVVHEFEFTNTGDAPLMIVSASTSCGCTKPEYPLKPLQPGEKGVLKVTFNPAGRPGEFTKTITIRTNVKGRKKVTLRIKGFVNPDK